MKNQSRGGRKRCFINLCFVGCFNSWWLRGDGVGQKVLFWGLLKQNLLFLVSTKIPEREGSISPIQFLWFWFWSSEWGVEVSQNFLLLPQGFERFASELSWERWPNLVHVKYLWMVDPMVVRFVLLEGWCYAGWCVWTLRTLAQFQGSEMRTRGQFSILSSGFVFAVDQGNREAGWVQCFLM